MTTGTQASFNNIVADSSNLGQYTTGADTSNLTASFAATQFKALYLQDDMRTSYNGTDQNSPSVVFTEFNKYSDSSVIIILTFYRLLTHIKLHVVQKSKISTLNLKPYVLVTIHI